MNEGVRQKLCEIVAKHGRSPLSDARLCESLLKDYCGQYKKEIFVLVCAVREQIALDLLKSQEGVPREMLHTLLVKRLQNNLALTGDASRWAVEAWEQAIAGLGIDGPKVVRSQSQEIDEFGPQSNATEVQASFSNPTQTFEGQIIGRCEKAIRSVNCASDGESIVCGSDDGTIRVWRFDSEKMEIVSDGEGAVSSVVFSPDGACVAAACEENTNGPVSHITIRELQTGETIELGQCSGSAPKIAYSPGGHRLAAASSDTENGLQTWNLHTGHSRKYKTEPVGLASISYSPVAKSVAAGDGGLGRAALRLYHLDSEHPTILGHCDRGIAAVAFSPDGKYIASGSWDETVRLWSVQPSQMRVLGKNCSRITCIAFSRDGLHVAAGSLDARIRIWNVQTSRSRTVGECQGISSVTFSTDCKSIFAGSLDGTLRFWPYSRLR